MQGEGGSAKASKIVYGIQSAAAKTMRSPVPPRFAYARLARDGAPGLGAGIEGT